MKLLFWCSDFNLHDGEGVLAVKLIKDATLLNNCTSTVVTPELIYRVSRSKAGVTIKDRKNNLSLFSKINYKKSSTFYKYILPLMGLFFLNKRQFKYDTLFYMNYLPLWNFLIFMFAGSRIRLGPITGSFVGSDYFSDNRKNNFNVVLRKYVFPALYRLSVRIIKYKKYDLLWPANQAVYHYLSNVKNVCKVLSPSLMYGFLDPSKELMSVRDKKYDILVYFRHHPSKNPDLTIEIIERLMLKYKVVVIGNDVSLSKVESLGYIPQKDITQLCHQVKLVVSCSNEASGIFFMEVASSGTDLLAFKKSGANLIKMMDNVHLVPELGVEIYLEAIDHILSDSQSYRKSNHSMILSLQKSFKHDFEVAFQVG